MLEKLVATMLALATLAVVSTAVADVTPESRPTSMSYLSSSQLT